MKKIKSFLKKCEEQYHSNHPEDFSVRKEIVWSRLKKIYPFEFRDEKVFLGKTEVYAPMDQTHNHFYICLKNKKSLLIQSPEHLGWYIYNYPGIKKEILGD